ncbi:hypothetical protein Dimus_000919 [Dionaea muscipula]
MIDGKGGEVTKVMSTPVVVYHYPSKTKRKTKMPFKLTRGLSVFHSFLFCLDSRSSFKRLDRHEHSLKQGFISRSFLSFLLGFFFAISPGFLWFVPPDGIVRIMGLIFRISFFSTLFCWYHLLLTLPVGGFFAVGSLLSSSQQANDSASYIDKEVKSFDNINPISTPPIEKRRK